MANTFVRAGYVLTLLFTTIAAVKGNRLYSNSKSLEEVVGQQSILSFERAPLNFQCSLEVFVWNCDDCDKTCKEAFKGYDEVSGSCSGLWLFRQCTCEWKCF